MKKATNKNPVYAMGTVAIIFASAVLLLCSIEISPLGMLFSSSNTTMLSTSDTSNTTSTPTGDVLNTKYLEITNHTFSEDLLFTIVNGTLINNSNNTINSAEVTVQFYDANGTLITSSTENAKFIILAPGENSSFSVRSDLGDEIASSYQVIPGGDIEVG
ncbi:MAG: FxLYD domain-containing protein [Nitrososphaeraceae archaeon]